MIFDDEQKNLLGLTHKVKSSTGDDLKVGDRVILAGKIIRIHTSGFMLVSIEGDKPQPPIIVHGGNADKVEKDADA